MTATNSIINKNDGGAILEKVITSNDLAGLSSLEKVQHVRNVCTSLGLNPLTKPIQLIKFQGKEVMYITKDAAEQLRKNHNVSIYNIETKVIDGIYIVTAHAKMADGRTDAATGAIPIKGLQGDALCNAFLKAETKAKRRVTLSICGLGMTVEDELDTMHGAKKVNIEMHKQAEEHQKLITKELEDDELESSFVSHMADIKGANTMPDLQTAFKAINTMSFKNKPDLLKQLIDAKDLKKQQLIADKVMKKLDEVNIETGEVLQ